MLICRSTIVEAITGNHSLICTFNTFHIKNLPAKIGGFTIFIQLTDGIGKHDFILEVHDLRESTIIGRAGAFSLTWPERLLTMNLSIVVGGLPIEHEGFYDLVLIADGQEIARQKFEARTPHHEGGTEAEEQE